MQCSLPKFACKGTKVSFTAKVFLLKISSCPNSFVSRLYLKCFQTLHEVLPDFAWDASKVYLPFDFYISKSVGDAFAIQGTHFVGAWLDMTDGCQTAAIWKGGYGGAGQRPYDEHIGIECLTFGWQFHIISVVLEEGERGRGSYAER